ncbi:MAG TPA: DUF1801 domain-containing protein [Flavipsychrobacter sp.]|jgi:uncharacterized protein YdhG (YjbR/CyaY superfamily)|nr:DUF1801 domain-containing protein [Flavipsychrobacter sp.]
MAKTDFKSIDEYHEGFPQHTQNAMTEIRLLIHEVVPNVEETISYQIPCFKYQGYLIYYASYAKHISLSYPFSKGFLEKFSKDLIEFKLSKAALQLPLDKPLPLDLIRKMIQFRKEENEQLFSFKNQNMQ